MITPTRHMPSWKNELRNIALTAVCSLFWLGLSFPAIAQNDNTNKPQPATEFPPDPLEFKSVDPLLPESAKNRKPLTDEERAELEKSLDELNAEAAEVLKAGNETEAFNIWFRELRLRRLLGMIPEVQALGRVGAIAWEQNVRPDVQSITKRLQVIQKEAEAKPPVDLALWRSLSTAYEQVRASDKAVTVYQQILITARQQEDAATQEATLLKIGELSLSWFDYEKAAITYSELLSLAQAKSDRPQQTTYLKQLAYIYEQLRQPQKIIETKQQLIELYLNEKDLAQIPPLKLAIGSTLESLGQTEEAAKQYEETYSFAWSIQLYSSAADALRKLVALQLSQKQIEEALETSQVLLQADRLAYNFYGMMNTYDQIAQLHKELKQYPEALQAFEKGLELAKQLKYRESYFDRQIQEVSQQITP